MAKLLEMPKLSPTMEEGQIASWSKKEGDAVAVDDLLAEVETDKATMEFRSFDKGTLLKILAPAGTVVKLGQPVAIIGEKGEDISALAGSAGGGDAPKTEAKGDAKPVKTGKAKDDDAPDEAARNTPKSEKKPDAEAEAAENDEGEDHDDDGEDDANEEPEVDAKPKAAKPSEVAPQPADAASSRGSDGRLKASPYVRKIAREQGLSLEGLAGTGPHGRIIARDLEGAKAPPRRASTPSVAGKSAPSSGTSMASSVEPEKRPLSMMRKAIARRLTESKQTVPHFYLSIDVDADPLHALREQVNADLAAMGEKAPVVKLSFNDIIVKAVAIALVQVPTCNAQFTPDAILIHRRVDISVAVAVDDGLVTPVVRDADKKSVAAIATEIRELAGRAKAKKLKPEEMSNGTFSISNLGMYGIDDFAAVINPPEGAILAIGQVRREPVVRGDAIVPGRRLGMTLSCDHRVVDGAVGATFLKALRGLLEHPSPILLL